MIIASLLRHNPQLVCKKYQRILQSLTERDAAVSATHFKQRDHSSKGGSLYCYIINTTSIHSTYLQ